MALPADGSQLRRPPQLGAAGPSQWTLLGRSRMPDARGWSEGSWRADGWHPCVRAGFDWVGPDRTLLDDRRYRMAARGRAANQSQCRVDAATTALDGERGSGWRPSMVQGAAARTPS